MATLTFYTNPRSRGRMVRWMLEEVGAPYETQILTFADTMKSPEYLAINPMGKVPAITHGDQVVTEVAAICAYLADAFPEAGLAPPPAERGAYYRWLFFAAGPLEAAMAGRSHNLEAPPEKAAHVGYGSFDLTVGTLEKALSAGPYVAGERFTAADVYVGSQLGFGRMFDIVAPRPAFDAYIERLTAREAYQRAVALDDAAATEPAG